MATSTSAALPSWSQRGSAPGSTLKGLQTEPEGFDFLPFLATAQALRIEFLPIVWDTGADSIGIGGTSILEQALVTADTSFAFKTFRERGETQPKEYTYQILIHEITILSQSFMRQHTNVAQLQGICFEISPNDDEPWPVLVFEKSHLGDLWTFSQRTGQNLTVDERLGICADITRAVIAMHANKIVHGDIKPQNVLIFREKSGKYCAKVIDFGNSAQYLDDGHKIEHFGSEAWAAPEYESGARWNQSQGIEADLFSLGLLYFWLFFERYMVGKVSSPSRLQKIGSNLVKNAEDWLEKEKDNIQVHAKEFLKAVSLRTEQEEKLGKIFRSSLSQMPGVRKTEPFENFLDMQDVQWAKEQTSTLTSFENEGLRSVFQIEKSIYAFYSADYRVRSHIARCLQKQTPRSESIDSQLALCYYIGFGVTRDEAEAEKILELSRQTTHTTRDIKKIVDAISEDANVHEAPEASGLRELGHVLFKDFAQTYFEQKKTGEAEQRLTQEVEDLGSTCGKDHLLTSILEFSLARIYAVKERWKDCEKLELRSLHTSKKKLGDDHTSTLGGMIHLATTYKNLDQWPTAIQLERDVMKILTSKPEPNHPDTLTCMNNLACSLWQRSSFKEAKNLFTTLKDKTEQMLGPHHPFTLEVASNLASVYMGMNHLDKALNLEKKVIETSKEELGKDHLITLRAMGERASILSYQGQTKKSQMQEEEILQIVEEKLKLPSSHSLVLKTKANLAETYYTLGNLAEAEKLEREVKDAYSEKHGLKDSRTLHSIYNLACTLKRQGRLEEALEEMRTCAGGCPEVFGPTDQFTLGCQAKVLLWNMEHMLVRLVSWLLRAPLILIGRR